MLQTRQCPLCGQINENLDLEETDGWYLCDGCGERILARETEQKITWVPVLDARTLADRVKRGRVSSVRHDRTV